MRSRRRYADEGEESIWIKALAGVGIAILLIGGGILAAAYIGKTQERAGIDPDTFCPKDGPTSATAVLIDRTDGINETQAEALKALVRKWRDEIPENGAFRVYEVKGSEGLPVPILSLCNPGAWEEGDELTSSERITRARYEQKFAEPIDTILAGMLTDREADSSPIMEAVQAIAVREFAPLKEGAQRRLIIVSDLLQHTPELSLYKAVPDIGAFRRSSYGQRVECDLHGVKTQVHRLNSATAKRMEEVVPFWLDWLMFQGADIEGLFKVPG